MDTTLPFDDVPRTPRGHLGLFFYEAALRVIRHVRNRAEAARQNPDVVVENFPFLRPYYEELLARQSGEFEWNKSLEWFREQRRRWEEETSAWLPLRGLRQELELNDDTLLALVLAGLVEEEPRFASLFAALQQPVAQRRPSLSLAHDIITERARSDADAWSVCRPLLEAGFLEAQDRESARSEWILRVPIAFWNALRGEPTTEPLANTHHHALETLEPFDALVLPESQLAQITEAPALLGSGQARSILIRGLPGTERLAVAGAIARALGRGLLEIDNPPSLHPEGQRTLGPLCTLYHAMPVFSLDLGPGESFELPALRGYVGPWAVIMGPEGGLNGAFTEHSVVIHLRLETVEERLQILRKTAPRTPQEALNEIAETFSLPGRYLRRATTMAECYAALARRPSITCEDVRQASRAINRQQLDALATRLEENGSWPHLVVRAPTEESLRQLQRRCRHRERLSSAMGAALPGGLNRGVRALFEGPSGTGKTLAARILAAELGLDLYRVDVAAIVNKYIGETEKNLSKVLTRAEDLDVVLLLDEGDSLMTRRTEVKSAHDRYANLETNYLLQRLETYSGIVIVTTNLGSSIDSAFRRRIDSVVKFYLPDASERWRLWQVHLPVSHAVPDAELEQIALRYEMTGGQIRNAVVQAALFAIDDSEECISIAHLRSAIQAEYRKAGAALPIDEIREEQSHDARINGFLSAIS